MEIELTKEQQDQLRPLFYSIEDDFKKETKGSIYAQVYDGFMSIYYINNACGLEMIEVMKKHYPERFKKKGANHANALGQVQRPCSYLL
jgi:hypothetical protein